MLLGHYLGRPSRAKFTGETSLKLADFSSVRHFLPAMAADISVQQAAELLRNPPQGLTIVDVRTPEEFRQGHLPGAENMRGKAEDATPYDFSLAPEPNFPNCAAKATALAYDIVYNPLETRFLREARAAGRRCVSGLEMFFGQGDAQFRLWTGQGLPPQSRRALEAALGGGQPE